MWSTDSRSKAPKRTRTSFIGCLDVRTVKLEIDSEAAASFDLGPLNTTSPTLTVLPWAIGTRNAFASAGMSESSIKSFRATTRSHSCWSSLSPVSLAILVSSSPMRGPETGSLTIQTLAISSEAFEPSESLSETLCSGNRDEIAADSSRSHSQLPSDHSPSELGSLFLLV